MPKPRPEFGCQTAEPKNGPIKQEGVVDVEETASATDAYREALTKSKQERARATMIIERNKGKEIMYQNQMWIIVGVVDVTEGATINSVVKLQRGSRTITVGTLAPCFKKMLKQNK